jgi:hypothetical protein
MSDYDFLDPAEAVIFLNNLGHKTSKATLAKLRCTGSGPLFQKMGKHIRYRPDRLREFVVAQLSPEMHSTSESANPRGRFVAHGSAASASL